MQMMPLKEILKQSNAVVGVVKDARSVLGAFRHDNTIGTNGRLIRRYMSSHAVRKLQIGAGFTKLDGWLSTDLEPRDKTSAFLDATKPFPFEDRTFDYVYSEHMIEHIPWKDGLFMLRECLRVLKPGGGLRVATPDLEVLMALYKDTSRPHADEYIHWITDRFLEAVPVYKPQFVINNAFTNWGHRFLYDAEVMAMALTTRDSRTCGRSAAASPTTRTCAGWNRTASTSRTTRWRISKPWCSRRNAPAVPSACRARQVAHAWLCVLHLLKPAADSPAGRFVG